MPEQLSFDLSYLPSQPRLRIVRRERADPGQMPEQLSIDFVARVITYIPRMPHRDTTCAGATPITRDGITLPAAEWAARLGIKWSTVKMRRLRGDNWTEALKPELRRTTFMSSWRMHA